MHILVLSEKMIKNAFYPISLTKHVADLKCGILSFRQKWETMAQQQGFYLVVADDSIERSAPSVVIPANSIPPLNLSLAQFFKNPADFIDDFKKPSTIWDIISINKDEIKSDIQRLNEEPTSFRKHENISLTGSGSVYIQDGAQLEHCYLNTSDGPIFIDEDATIMEGAMLRGPLYIGKSTVVKMGTTLYQGTSVGDFSVVGGEIKNTIIHGFSNKSHHGYIGDSYIGEWCNLGAGTTGSNLKNTAGMIMAWNKDAENMVEVGNKAGVVMGDHVKTAINTLFNSGSIIGPFCNIFGSPSPIPKFVPEFSWGTDASVKYQIDKLILGMQKWMTMKDQILSDKMIERTRFLYNN